VNSSFFFAGSILAQSNPILINSSVNGLGVLTIDTTSGNSIIEGVLNADLKIMNYSAVTLRGHIQKNVTNFGNLICKEKKKERKKERER